MNEEELLWLQGVRTYTSGTRWIAEAMVRKKPASEASDDPSVYSPTVAAAWDACELALKKMAEECNREADECRKRAATARESEVTRVVA